MNYLRNRWYDIGIVLALAVAVFLLIRTGISSFQFLLWVSLLSLFLHQFEEYRFPGYFPGMVNTVMFGSKHPDRYPLNTNTSLIVNVFIGWPLYFLAALLAEKTVWLAIASVVVSVGNIIVHTFVFNFKGRTVYNPGMATATLLFLPISVYFFYFIERSDLAKTFDYVVGIPFGLIINYVGVIKIIEWLKDEHTKYVFPARCVS